jgi:hypothetical protein
MRGVLRLVSTTAAHQSVCAHEACGPWTFPIFHNSTLSEIKNHVKQFFEIYSILLKIRANFLKTAWTTSPLTENPERDTSMAKP